MARFLPLGLLAWTWLAILPSVEAAAPHPAPIPAPLPGHWAFRLPTRPVPPSLPPSSSAGLNPLDAFIRASLLKAGLAPAAPADRITLIRRVTFDLTGLPPTPEEVRDFLADRRPDAYERLVDRLLASPRYGERWAQHWLDVVRFAETNGFEADGERPQAWRYRDWVVRSLNADKPYDRFVLEQLAGDLLTQAKPDNDSSKADLWVAAGFNRCGPNHEVGGNVDPAETRQEVLTEMVSGVGAAFLGLTINCARCHDHKFDPISLEEYYQLEAFFSQAQFSMVELTDSSEQARHKRELAAFNARLGPLRNQISTLEAPYRIQLTEAKKARLEAPYRKALDTPAAKRTPEQKMLAAHAQTLIKVTWDEVVAALTPADRARRSELRRQMHELEAQRPPAPARAWTLREEKGELASYVLRRGSLQRKGARVRPAFPKILRPTTPPKGPLNRIALAQWLVSRDNPLTARVIVNRLWQHHFGKGLVRTPNDFGTRGDIPSHPELLDWLACELMDNGWSLKHLHRLMVTSATYKQSSVPSPEARRIDPDNRFLSHMNRQRLQGEALRDAVLAVAGTLTPHVGGPSIRVPLEPEVYELIFTEGEPDGLWLVTPDPREHNRRSLYLFNKRNVRLPLLEAFDQPDTLNSCPVRPVSTFAPQALILLNGPFMQQQSRDFAARLLREVPQGPAQQIERAFQLALARPPRPAEQESALRFLREQADLVRDQLRARRPAALPAEFPTEDPAHAAALSDFCLALLNRNAFVHID